MSTTYEDLPLTSFPENVDSFLNYLNITATDAPLIKQYFEAIQASNMVEAQSIYMQIPQNSQKILTAEKLNHMSQAISALQRFYKSDIQDYVVDKQEQWENIIDQFTYKGIYSATTNYQRNNYVTYTVSGLTGLYIAIKNSPMGITPNNNEYWRILTVSGVAGQSGSGLSFVGEWNGSQAYILNDCVTYSGALWGCTQPNINQTPVEGSDYWQLIYRGTATIYPLSVNPPPSPNDGDLWFQIV